MAKSTTRKGNAGLTLNERPQASMSSDCFFTDARKHTVGFWLGIVNYALDIAEKGRRRAASPPLGTVDVDAGRYDLYSVHGLSWNSGSRMAKYGVARCVYAKTLPASPRKVAHGAEMPKNGELVRQLFLQMHCVGIRCCVES